MNVKIKTTLIIIFTLVIGIILGAMLNRALLQRRIAHAFSLRNPATFPARLQDVLAPNPEQWREIRKIMEKHLDDLMEIREDFENRMMAANAALMTELDPILTSEQKRRLRGEALTPREFFRERERVERFPRRGPRGFENPPMPPFPGPGPAEDMDDLYQRLGLSGDQLSRIKSLLREERYPMSPVIEGRNLERMIRWWKSREEERFRLIAGLLTEEQRQLYAETISARRQRLLDILAGD